MKKIYFLSFLFLLHFCFAQSYDLRLNLNENETYPLKNDIFVEAKQKVKGMDINVDFHILTTMTYKVMAKNKDGYQLEGKHTFYKTEVRFPGNYQIFSSDQTTTFLDLGLAKIINVPFTVFVNYTGEIQKITGYDAIVELLLSEFPAEAKESSKEQLSEMFSENVLKTSFAQMVFYLPKNKIKVNDSWSKTGDYANKFVNVFTKKFILNKVDDQYFYLSSKGTANSDPTKPILINQENFSPVLAFEEIGNYTINRKTGWISSAKIELKYKGTLDAKSLDMKIDTQSVMTSKLEDKIELNGVEKSNRLQYVSPPPPQN